MDKPSASNDALHSAMEHGVRIGLEAAVKTIWERKRHLGARDIAAISALDPSVIIKESEQG